jgi:diguanylate cyclase (GGDEF)-like protein
MPLALPVLLDLALIVALCSILFILAARRRSFAQLERQLQEMRGDHAQCNLHVQTLSELNRALQSSETLERAVELTVPFLPRLFAVPAGALYVLRPPAEPLSCVYRWGELRQSDVLLPDECFALVERRPWPQPPPPDPRRCLHLSRIRGEQGPDGPGASAPLSPAMIESGGPAGEHARCEDLCVPIAVNNVTLALLTLHDPRGHARELLDSPFVASAIEQIALAIWNLKLREALRQQSILDSLTQLYNRRYLEESLPREFSRAERAQREGAATGLALMMIDVDHFKRFNDQYGHEAGDALLVQLGVLLRALTRGSDIASRYGGEEFVLALADVTLDDAIARAEEIRAAVEALEIPFGDKLLPRATISLGLAFYPDHADAPTALIRAADAAMYAAKHEGRNCVRLAPAAPPNP